MTRILVLLAMIWPPLVLAQMTPASPSSTAIGERLRYPQDLAPVDGEGAEVSVQMAIAANGLPGEIQVLESNRPESNQAVIDALSGWRFRPVYEQGKLISPTRLSFSFTAGAEPDQPPTMQSVMQVNYPEGMRWSGKAEPEVVLELAISAQGRVQGAKVLQAQDPALIDVAVRRALAGQKVVPALKDGEPVAASLQVVPQFIERATVRKQVTPRYPQSLLNSGNVGEVSVSFEVDEGGNVVNPRIASSPHPAFEQATLDALLQWTFHPAKYQGQPIAAQSYGQRFVFRLDSVSLVPAFSGFSAVTPQPPYALGGRAASRELPKAFQYDVAPAIRATSAAVYPFDLLLAETKGSATVNVALDDSGRVWDVMVLEATNPEFGWATKAMLESWRFSPATKHSGERSWALFSRTQRFDLHDRDTKPSEGARRLLRQLRKGGSDIHAMSDLDGRPVARYQVQPVYPRAEREAGIEDQVVVEFIIDRDGVAQLPKAVTFRNEALAWAAVTAISRWRYEPPLKAGKAVDVKVRMPVIFEKPAPASD